MVGFRSLLAIWHDKGWGNPDVDAKTICCWWTCGFAWWLWFPSKNHHWMSLTSLWRSVGYPPRRQILVVSRKCLTTHALRRSVGEWPPISQRQGISSYEPVKLRQDSPWFEFLVIFDFLHHGIEEVKRHLLWKFYKKTRRKSWSNVPPKSRLHRVSIQSCTQNRPSPKVQSLSRDWI